MTSVNEAAGILVANWSRFMLNRFPNYLIPKIEHARFLGWLLGGDVVADKWGKSILDFSNYDVGVCAAKLADDHAK